MKDTKFSPKKGVILIPDDRFHASFRIDEVWPAEEQNSEFWNPDPPGTFRIGCTRFDLTETREPVTSSRGDPNHIFVIRHNGHGWIQVESVYDDDEPMRFEEYGQLQLF